LGKKEERFMPVLPLWEARMKEVYACFTTQGG